MSNKRYFAAMLVTVSLLAFSSSYLVSVSGQAASLTLTSTESYTLTTTSYSTNTQSRLYTSSSITRSTSTTTITSTSTALMTDTTETLRTVSGTRTITTVTTGSTIIPYPTGRTIGYIGCSNAEDAVAGYQMVTSSSDSHFWYAYNTGGGVLNKWALTPSNNFYWTGYQQQVVNYGQPKIVWIEICEYSTVIVTPLMVNETIANLRSFSPKATIYVSPLNTYDPVGSCSLTGANGIQDATNLADQAVKEGLALPGPILGPLNNQNTVGGGCHPNQAGEILEGNQLNAFFNGQGIY
ncbi:MAG: hypothetical protein ACLPY5_16830 [Candidatus Bathyarchaeia archaeon]